MSDVTATTFSLPAVRDSLHEVLREGARKMLAQAIEAEVVDGDGESTDGDEGGASSSAMRYRRQQRGGKGVKDIKTTIRNGPVVALSAVHEDDEVLMITAGGKIQRFRASTSASSAGIRKACG